MAKKKKKPRSLDETKKTIKINGKDCDWEIISINIMGVEIKGITTVEYTPSIVDFSVFMDCQSYLLSEKNQN